MEGVADNTVAGCAVPSVLERYGAGWDDEPPSPMRIIA
jgi:hypothetical protein